MNQDARNSGRKIWAYDPVDDKPREECGVFAVCGYADAALVAALGLHALQHRGQEGCGVASYDGAHFHNERHLGLVGDHFAGAGVAERLPGRIAIGHTRYPTAGGVLLRNVQPLYAELPTGGFAIAHNGNLTNALTLRADLRLRGSLFQSTSDTEVILQQMARSRRRNVLDRFIDALQEIEGAYALVCLAGDSIIAARDPRGIRPLVMGELDGATIIASETCALDMVGARFKRAIEPGEVLMIRDGADGPVIESRKPFPHMAPRPCVFEYVYFARPDSIVDGRSIYEVRKLFGRRLAEETPAAADIVVPVPDSGVPAALGYSEISGVPYELGIIRNHYVGRTFIQPKQEARASKVKMKHSANRSVLEGKRVVLVDDSIVRGTTSAQIVKLVRDAGAAEVHLRIASPPIKHPDFYGIDMPTEEELIAATTPPAEMAKKLGADSVGFLSVDGMYWALCGEKRDPAAPRYSDHCFTGDYPTPLEDKELDQSAGRGAQLPLLSELT